MRWPLAFVAAAISISQASALEYTGRANAWTFYQTDDVDSTTVAIVKDASGQELGIAVGRDIAVECAVAGRTCEYRKIGNGTELELERVTDAGRVSLGKIGGDTLLTSLGLDGRVTQGEYLGRFSGNTTFSLLDNRALGMGYDRARFRISELYGELKKKKFQMRAGRQPILGGVLVDGVSGDYFLGPDFSADSKTIGAFGGLAPDPISKMPSKDFITSGATYRWIPNFSQSGDAKLSIEGSLVSEFYKMKMNRFFLYSQLRFSPIKPYSTLIQSQVDLPWSGSNSGLSSSLLSLQNFWRPNSAWFFSFGFTQFKIDRYLQERAIRWVTDNTPQQTRLGDTLDRSQRYRLDVRASVKPIPLLQPFGMFRYERRTFDENKRNLNSDSNTPAQLNLGLVNRKNAYQGTLGVRVFPRDELETETSGTYGQRYQSKFYSLFQSATWEAPGGWAIQGDFQYLVSNRTQDMSIPNTLGPRERAVDWYGGLGASYRFLSDFMGQIRYDFGNEDDFVLDRRISSHSVLARVDYKF